MTEVGKPIAFSDSREALPLDTFLHLATAAPYLCVDTESNGEDVRDGRGYLQGISLSFMYDTRVATMYFSVRHKFGFNYPREIQERLRELFSTRDKHDLPNLYHNSKFDIPSLTTFGIKLKSYHNHYCTMLMSHLLNENLFAQSLQSVSKHYLGNEYSKVKSPELEKIIKAFGWGHIPSEVMYEYALQDSALGLLVFLKMLPDWEKEQLDAYWHRHKRKTIEVVMSMERRGVLIDQELCRKNLAIGEQEMEDVKEILGLNPGSPKDLKKLLIDELQLPVQLHKKTGNPTFDKDAMEIYDQILERRGDATAIHILTYRGWQKTTSSNYRSYLKLLSPDGRLRCNYKLHGTKTGRFSCADPNLQQIPKKSVKPWNRATKTAFTSPEGYSLWGFDYAQLELRLATAYAGVKSLIQVFEEDRDIFDEMSLSLNMVRPDTKTFVYSTQYGGGNKRISDVFGISMERAAEIRAHYFSTYPGFRTVSNLASNTAKSSGKVKLWSGRYRHFMWPQSEAHKAFNSAIQGGAADIVEGAMHRAYEQVDNEEDCQLLLQIHDELAFQIKDSVAAEVVPEIKRIMEAIPQDFGVKFKVEAKRFGG